MQQSTIEKVFLIEGVEMFASNNVDDLLALASIAQERRYAAGETIYHTNDEGNAVYIIIDGEVRIEKDGLEILILGATESFGETSLLDGAPRPAAAIAAHATRVLWIDRHDFLDLVSERPELLKGVFAAVTRNLRRVIDVAAASKLPVTQKAG
jgi:CRP-like cAMP-binding protein